MSDTQSTFHRLLEDSWSDWKPFFLFVARGVAILLIAGAVMWPVEWVSEVAFGEHHSGILASLGLSAMWGLATALAGALVLPLLGSMRRRLRSIPRLLLWLMITGSASRLCGELAGSLVFNSSALLITAGVLVALSITGWILIDRVPVRWLRWLRTWLYRYEGEPEEDNEGASSGS